MRQVFSAAIGLVTAADLDPAPLPYPAGLKRLVAFLNPLVLFRPPTRRLGPVRESRLTSRGAMVQPVATSGQWNGN